MKNAFPDERALHCLPALKPPNNIQFVINHCQVRHDKPD